MSGAVRLGEAVLKFAWLYEFKSTKKKKKKLRMLFTVHPNELSVFVCIYECALVYASAR